MAMPVSVTYMTKAFIKECIRCKTFTFNYTSLRNQILKSHSMFITECLLI